MGNHETDEDSIDLVALQAQIDLSMSIVQDMVSSWVKPSNTLSTGKKDSEAELKEYMRRPPRLGVGAPIPEVVNLSRETVRLRGQLSDKTKKRSRDEEDAKIPNHSADDDEEESRGNAIKKKARVDPFGGRNKNKSTTPRQGQPEATPIIPPEKQNAPKLDRTAQAGTDNPSDKRGPPVASPTCSETETQDRRHHTHLPGPAEVADAEGSQSATATLITKEQPLDVRHNNSTPKKLSNAQKFMEAELLKHPLLNLAPLSVDDQSADEAGHSPNNTPAKKNKRKRNKKKKNHAPETPIHDTPQGATV